MAAIIAIPLGLMIGRMKILRQLLDPTINLLRPIPVTAWLPLSMIFFGLGPIAAIFLVFLGAFYPILLNTTFGVRSVDPDCSKRPRCVDAPLGYVPTGGVSSSAACDLQRAASRTWFRVDPDRGRRDDRRTDGPRLSNNGRPHIVAHRFGHHRHDRDRRDGICHRPDHRRDLEPRAKWSPTSWLRQANAARRSRRHQALYGR